MTGQLEIYRGGGETTLVTSDGRRIEVIRDKSGSVRIEMYALKFFFKKSFFIQEYGKVVLLDRAYFLLQLSS